MNRNVRTNDEAVTESKKLLVIYFTFGRDTTNLWGSLVENVKESKISPPKCTITNLRINLIKNVLIFSELNLWDRLLTVAEVSSLSSCTGEPPLRTRGSLIFPNLVPHA
jgi:hypothetical protein